MKKDLIGVDVVAETESLYWRRKAPVTLQTTWIPLQDQLRQRLASLCQTARAVGSAAVILPLCPKINSLRVLILTEFSGFAPAYSAVGRLNR